MRSQPVSRTVTWLSRAVVIAALAATGSVPTGPAAASTPLAAPLVNALGTPIGMDVSSWQHLSGRAIDWPSVRAAGHDFTIIKATEGTTYTNPYYTSDAFDSAQAGLIHGAYHYARPGRPVASDAVAEATAYVAVAGLLHDPGVLPPVLDLEENGVLTPAELISWTQTWLDTVQQLTGRAPIIYTYRYFWSTRMAGTTAFNATNPLWLADYNATFGGTVGGWPSWMMWQYTAGASVPGVYGKVDMNRFNGSLDQLIAMANGLPVPVILPPAGVPTAPTAVTATVNPDGTALVSWQPSLDNGSPLMSYTVIAAPGGQSVTVAPDQLSAIVPGVTPDTPNTFTVFATNAAGVSPAGSSSVPDPATPVTPAAPVTTAMTVTVSASTVTYGASVAVSGRLTRADTGAPIADRTVVLESRTATSGQFTPIASLTTSADGAVSSIAAPLVTTEYRLRYDGGTDAASNATQQVRVAPLLSYRLSSRAAHVGQHLVLAGQLRPAYGGRVYRQILLPAGWTTLDKALVSRTGTFAFRVIPVIKGTKIYRVISRGSAAATPIIGLTTRLRVV